MWSKATKLTLTAQTVNFAFRGSQIPFHSDLIEIIINFSMFLIFSIKQSIITLHLRAVLSCIHLCRQSSVSIRLSGSCVRFSLHSRLLQYSGEWKWRKFSYISSSTHLAQPDNGQNQGSPICSETTEGELNPSDLLKSGKLQMPAALSPSSATEFIACPQSFLFQYLMGLKQPPNLALSKGSLVHAALEKVFSLPPPDRSVDAIKKILVAEWSAVKLTDTYHHLFQTSDTKLDGGTTHDSDSKTSQIKEDVFIDESMRLLDNYYEMEDPRTVKPPNPLRREIWVTSKISIGNYLITSDTDSSSKMDNAPHDNILVRGIVDRLDLICEKDSSTGHNLYVLRIIDYKTGKAPDFLYSREVNQRIAEEKFWQLKVYALLVQDMQENQKGGLPKYPVRFLRLMYLTSESGKAQYLEMDLGDTHEKRKKELDRTRSDLIKIWLSIQTLVLRQEIKGFKHCERPFCYCNIIRPKFKQGTVWERS